MWAKKFFSRLAYVVYLTFVCLLFVPGVSFAAERIASFETTMTIFKNGNLSVLEQIDYDFGNANRHGIFREIPLVGPDGHRIFIRVDKVYDADGNAYPYILEGDKNTLRVRIGDPNKTVIGKQQYRISYIVQGAIRPFEQYDELYWNVTGDEWNVPIDRVSAQVFLPVGSSGTIQMTCFTGERGSTNQDCNYEHTQQNRTARFNTHQPLAAYEGMSIVVALPKGIFDAQAIARVIKEVPSLQGIHPDQTVTQLTNLAWFSFILVVWLISRVIAQKRKRVKARIPRALKHHPIVTQFSPPEGLRPIDVGTLLDQKVDLHDISSIIIDLAVRGYIKIRYIHKEIPFWPDKKDFELIKLKEGSELSHPAEKALFELLFTENIGAKQIIKDFFPKKNIQQGIRESVLLSDLKKEKYRMPEVLKNIKDSLHDYLDGQGYLDNKKRKKTQTIEIIVIAILLFFGSLSGNQILIWAIFPLFLVWLVVRYRFMEYLTNKGINTLAHILGFKQFLEVTETDRLAFFNAPAKNPEVFERFLPYAMVLGVEKQWAQEFDQIYQGQPEWYSDSDHAAFSSTAFVGSMAAFSSSFNTAVRVSSARSGSSGGSSGGGSGGGGGGSW